MLQTFNALANALTLTAEQLVVDARAADPPEAPQPDRSGPWSAWQMHRRLARSLVQVNRRGFAHSVDHGYYSSDSEAVSSGDSDEF